MYKIVESCWPALFIVVSVGSLHGDTIKFKDGTSIQGKIVAEMDEIALIRTGDGNTHKVDRNSILGVIKGPAPPPKQKRFKISDIEKLTLDEMESDLASLLEKMEPLHAKTRKGLNEGLVLARIAETDEFFEWLVKWYETSPATMSLDDIIDLRPLTKNTYRTLDYGINYGKAKCRSCDGKDVIVCRKCRGLGRIRSGFTKVATISKDGIGSKAKLKTMRCPGCKGTGRAKCLAESHKYARLIKKLGGIEKVLQVERSADTAIRKMSPIFHAVGPTKTKKELYEEAGNAYRLGYYYITLEILKRYKEKR